jgi:GT2 family glycosyltransferase
VVICAGGRESLIDTLKSLTEQTYKGFQVAIRSEQDDLSKVRQRGLSEARGKYVTFIDDDVYCTPRWLESIIREFESYPKTVGVTGPTIITREFLQTRDLFRFKNTGRIYDLLFNSRGIPSQLSSCGCPSRDSNKPDGYYYHGRADFLEACNMSVKKKEALDVGGFDPRFIRTSEWCEVDLALKLRAAGNLIFNPNVKLYHRPSMGGVYKHRLTTRHRWDNFIAFQRKWEGTYITKSANTYLYRGFVWLYFRLKEILKF